MREPGRGAAHLQRHADRAGRRPDRHRQGLRARRPAGSGPAPASCTSTSSGARGLAARLEGRPFTVTRVEEKPYRRRPYAPFITSTLQQEAARKLRFSSQQTMRTAQRLYENGYITYMRTDSVNLSETAIAAARRQIAELYGDAQRAAAAAPLHRQGEERAGGARGDPPGRGQLPHPGRGGQGAVRRGVQALRADLAAHHRLADDRRGRLHRSRCASARSPPRSEEADFGATGKTITDPGFLRAYVESSDDENAEAEDAERRLPTLVKDQPLTADELEPRRATPPSRPPRYTEASLVKALEELGIGRPSTYASIMQTIQDRGYVFKRGQALIPSFLAFAVIGLLERHFPRLVDYDFTAAMENELDEIAGGDARRGRLPAPRSTSAAPTAGDRLDRPRRRAEEAGHREPRRDRRAQRQLDPAVHRRRRAARSSCGSAGTGRTCSGRCPAAASRRRRSRARRAAARATGRRSRRASRPDELTPEKVARAVPRRRRRAQARRAPGDRRADRAQVRPVRPVRVQRRAQRPRCCARRRRTR